MQGPHDAGFLAVLQGLLEEGAQFVAAHEHAVQDFAVLQGKLLLDLYLAVLADELDAHVTGLGHGDGLLAGEEVAAAHVVGVGTGGHAPLAHGVRVLASVGLDGCRGAAVGVAFAQDRVHGAAQHFGVAGAGVLVFFGLRVFREVRHVVAQGLQFGDSAFQLRHGGTDVRQFDNVGVRRGGQDCQVGQVVFDALVCCELVSEGGQDASCKRDVAGFDVDAGRGGEGFDDGKERVGGERRSFVGEGVRNLRTVGH
ncbi:hypothetical protein D3C78_930700 [compost metagenome]